MIKYSATQLQMLQVCPRKWWYGYGPLKLKAPPGASQQLGSAIHAELEHVFKDSQVPQPEHKARAIGAIREIARLDSERFAWPASEIVKVAKEPLDWFSNLGANPAMGSEINFNIDIARYGNGTCDRRVVTGVIDLFDGRDEKQPIVVDYKTTRDLKYLKTEYELETDAQMTVYAKLAFDLVPEAESVIVRHIGIPTRGPAAAVSCSATVHKVDVEERWKGYLQIFDDAELYRSKAEAIDVPAEGIENGECDRFGGCFYKPQCHSAQIFAGKMGADEPTAADMFAARQGDFMGAVDVLARIKAKQAEAAAAAPAAEEKKLEVIEQRIDATTAQAMATSAGAVIDQPEKKLSPLERAKLAKLAAQGKSPPPAPPVAPPKQGIETPADHSINKPAPAPTATPKTNGEIKGLRLFINCRPAKGDVVELEVLMQHANAAIVASTGKRWQQLPYREGPGMLLDGLKMMEHKLPAQLFVDRASPMGQILLEALIPLATEIIEGTR